MREAIEQYVEALYEDERYCSENEVWQFSDGSACAICTSSANLIARQFAGVVLGYYSINNPTAVIGLPNWDGHDFALIEERWFVDYWTWRVAEVITTPIFDLKEQSGRLYIHNLYGDAGRWNLVESFIKHG